MAYLVGFVLFSLGTTSGQTEQAARLTQVRRIWDEAPHNAFTDLIRFQGRWYCVFREGASHVSPDGALRIITSEDGEQWESAALLSSPIADLRDAKITITPDERLMLSGAAALHQPAEARHQSMVWFSSDGRNWSSPVDIGEPNLWIWRVTWHRDVAYGIGYSTVTDRFTRLYTSTDGERFGVHVDKLFTEGYPNEHSLVFLDDDTCLCLLRRDGEPANAQLGIASPPYDNWRWKDLGVRLGGPHMILLDDGRIVASGRVYDGSVRTTLLWLDPDKDELTEFLELPSGGDTSYPGLVFHDGELWVSYYSSHEAKTSIYLAKVSLGPAAPYDAPR